MNDTSKLSPDASPLRIANFRAYWLSRLSMTLAQYAMMLIIGWQTYNLARDGGMGVGAASGQLALIGLLQFIPLFLLTPFSGWAADHFDRRNIARLTVLAQLGCAGTLAWFTWNETLTVTVLFGVAIVLGIVRAFNGPALSALAPNLVPKAILPNAIALSSIAWQVGMIVGPAIGGYTYAILPALPYITAFALFAVSLAALSFIGKVPQPARAANRRPIHQMVEGLRYVVRNNMVLGAITLDLFAVFLAGATALFPVYARDILEVGVRSRPMSGPRCCGRWQCSDWPRWSSGSPRRCRSASLCCSSSARRTCSASISASRSFNCTRQTTSAAASRRPAC